MSTLPDGGRKLNICIDISAAVQQTAGIGRYTTRLAEHLLMLDTENNYFFFHNVAGRGEMPAFARGKPNISVRLANKQWRARLILAHGLGVNMDRRFPGVDIFHGTDVIYPPLKKAKVVTTVHDLTFFLFPEFHTWPNRINMRLMVPRLVRHADAVIADSENTKNDVERMLKMPGDKIRVVPLGVEESFAPVPRDEARAHLAGNYGITGPFILHTGTLEPRKNIGTLIEAFATLKANRGFPHKLVIAGKKGWLFGSLFDLVREKGLQQEVIFTGFVPDEDLPALYSAADLFVFPAFYEGFGLPPLEAMACGTPVICSKSSSLPEVVGDAGILIDPHDVGDLARALERVLGDGSMRQQMSAAGLARAKQFTWEKTARATLEIYRTVFTSQDSRTGGAVPI